MKKMTKIIALVLAVVMVFSGCATMEQSTVIKNDGTVIFTSKIELDKEEYDAMCMENYPDVYTSPEVVENTLRENNTGVDNETGIESKFEIITKEDGKSYYVTMKTVTSKLSYEDRYSDANGEYGFHDDYLTKDTVYLTFNGNEFAYNVAIMDSIDTANEYDLNKAKLTCVVEFPANIVASQGGEIDSANPKKITFDLPIKGGKFTAFATTNPNVTIATVKADIKDLTTTKQPKIKSVKVKAVKKKKGSVLLKWSKVKNAKYEVQYSTSKKFKKKVTKTKKTTKNSVTIKNLKKGKKYYFRVRAYKVLNEEKIYSKYSKKKSIKVVKKSKKK